MQENKIFIIGGGATAAIVKLFYPDAKIIAPDGRSFLPIHYVWETPETLQFMKDFNIAYTEKNVKVFKGTKPEEIEYYNNITHKPKGNKPSAGKKEIKTLICNLPDFPIDIKETVSEITQDKIITDNNAYEYDLVFICSPLLFEPFKNIVYYPMRIYKCEFKDHYDWDYAYLGGELLKHNIYRASIEGNYLFLEQTGTEEQKFIDIELWFQNFFGADITITASFINKFAHFDKPDKINEDTPKWIYASRLSSLDNEFLFSDLIKKMYEIKNGQTNRI